VPNTDAAGTAMPAETLAETGNTVLGSLKDALSSIKTQVNEAINSVKETMQSVSDSIKQGVDSVKETMRSVSGSIKQGLNSFFKRFSKPEEPRISETPDTTPSDYMTVPGGDSLNFYQRIMTPTIANQYSYETNKQYMCNAYVRDMILAEYGRDTYDMIFQGRDEDTNTMFESFKTNPNLEKLEPAGYSLEDIQAMANSGVLVLMIYQNLAPNERGHIAFIAHNNVKLFTVPDKAVSPNGLDPQQNIYGTELSSVELTVAQAGVYAGFASIRFATNGWIVQKTRDTLRTNNLYFYTVKKR
jgi:DNA-binding ferritin-like protein